MADKIYLKGTFGFREDTKENWERVNPILERGEPAVVRDAVDENWLKIGDGVTHWADLPWKKGPKGERGPKGEGIGLDTEVGGAIFNDYENNQAGLKGFSIQSTGVTQTDSDVAIPLDSVEGIEVGDIVSVQISNNYDYIGSVSVVDAENICVIVTLLDPITLPMGKSGTLWLPYKPYVGTTILGEYGLAANINTIAAAKGSASFGEANTAGGKRSFCAGGEENFAGYACFVAGQDNKIRGIRCSGSGWKNDIATGVEYGSVSGTNNKVRSNGTHIEGSGNTDGYKSYMGSNHIEGTGNTIEDGNWGKHHIEGTDNTVKAGNVGTCHIEGTGNTVSANVSHIQGSGNTVSGSEHDVGGTNNTVSGRSNVVRGTYNTVNGNSIFTRGTSHTVAEGASYISVAGYDNTIDDGAFRTDVFGFQCKVESGTDGAWGINSVEGVLNTLGAGHGSANRIEGNSNATEGAVNATHIEGSNNKAINTGDYDFNANYISGYGNTLTDSKYTSVFGTGNKVSNAQAAEIGGTRNAVEGSANFVRGNDTTVNGTGNYVLGMSSSVNGDNNRTLMRDSSVYGNDNVVLGNNLNVGTKENPVTYQAVLGKYNAQDAEAQLIIGVGTSGTDRRSGFVVKKDGSARILTESTEDDAAVRYSQIKPLFEKIAQLEEKIAQLEYEISALKGGE